MTPEQSDVICGLVHAATGISASDAVALIQACDAAGGAIPDDVTAQFAGWIDIEAFGVVQWEVARHRKACFLNWPAQVRGFFRTHPEWVPRFASDVPVGWDAIVADALAALHDLHIQTGVAVRIAQIKQKMAERRIYVDLDESSAGGLEIISDQTTHMTLRAKAKSGSIRQKVHEIVDMAAQRSARACESCGAEGVTRKRDGYLFVACDSHAAGGVPVDAEGETP